MLPKVMPWLWRLADATQAPALQAGIPELTRARLLSALQRASTSGALDTQVGALLAMSHLEWMLSDTRAIGCFWPPVINQKHTVYAMPTHVLCAIADEGAPGAAAADAAHPLGHCRQPQPTGISPDLSLTAQGGMGCLPGWPVPSAHAGCPCFPALLRLCLPTQGAQPRQGGCSVSCTAWSHAHGCDPQPAALGCDTSRGQGACASGAGIHAWEAEAAQCRARGRVASAAAPCPVTLGRVGTKRESHGCRLTRAPAPRVSAWAGGAKAGAFHACARPPATSGTRPAAAFLQAHQWVRCSLGRRRDTCP